MGFSRARYVTVCQQFLVTASVVAVSLSAAGVMTLQIVAPEATAPAITVTEGLAGATQGLAAVKPVTPKVREVKVVGIETAPDAAAKRATGPKRLAALSKPTAVHGYATVGVTWKHGTALAEDDINVSVRTRKDGAWSGW